MGDLLGLSFLVSFIIGIIALMAMLKIFTIASELNRLNKNFSDFMKYYGDLQTYKDSKK